MAPLALTAGFELPADGFVQRRQRRSQSGRAVVGIQRK